MPKVETYDSPVVGASPLRTPLHQDAPRGAFVDQVGAGIVSAASSGFRIAEDQRQKDDVAVTKERVNAYREFSRQRLYLDQDAYMTRQGRSAYDTYGEMQKELDDHKTTLAKDLTPRQQRAFDSVIQQYLMRDLDGMARHAQNGRIAWLNEQDEATIQSAQQDGSLLWNDPEPWANQIRDSIGNLAERNGWPPEQRELREQQALSAMHAAAIDNIIAQAPEEAMGYLQENIEEIVPAMRETLRDTIEEEEQIASDQALVESYVARFIDDEKAGRKYIRDNFEGEEEDRLIRRFNARMAEENEKERVAMDETMARAINEVWNGGGIDAIDPQDERYLKERGKWDLIGAEHVAKVTGSRQHNDYQWLANNYYNLSPQEQLRIPLDELKQHTDYSTYADLVTYRSKLQAPEIDRTMNDLIKTRLATFGIDLNNDKDEDNRERVNAFYDAYGASVQEFLGANQRMPTKTERQTIIEEVTASYDLYVNKGGWFWFDSIVEGPKFEVFTQENLVELEDELDIPAVDISRILLYMEQRGITPNKKNIQQVWNAGS